MFHTCIAHFIPKSQCAAATSANLINNRVSTASGGSAPKVPNHQEHWRCYSDSLWRKESGLVLHDEGRKVDWFCYSDSLSRNYSWQAAKPFSVSKALQEW